MRKILCPTDFSKTSTRAMEYAAFLASQANAQLTLLHVTHLPLAETAETALVATEVVGEMNRDATDKLASACNYLKEQYGGSGWDCDYEVKTAFLADAVRNYVVHEGYDLVVVGSTGGGNTLEEILIGSNTLAIIEDVYCPVLSIPTNARKPRIQKIAYASDLQNADTQALKQVLELAALTGAHVEVVHIDKKTDTEGQQKAAEFGRKIEEMFAAQNVHFSAIIHPDEEVGLKDYLTKTNTDLLVILKRHRSFFSNLFHSSLTEKLTYHSKFPMLVLDEKAQATV
ncbi:universal stress protein [Adhaeribacter sp. BT258]|uniref:Universal stress protein n=1 Tax=Adhaeribacter terrigena TaxID=2793070 RepID=A0ABS1C3S3_9BACT|nr:universal stress protein [Adhaeribacter terrigena]MBK0403958.1 universal stress protein [Adhaeribacter terrigena]